MKFYETKEFRKQQRQWYQRLKTEGFKDVENGQDTNRMQTSTLKCKSYNNHAGEVTFCSTTAYMTSVNGNGTLIWTPFDNTDRFMDESEFKTPADTPRGLAWRRFAQEVNELDESGDKEVLLSLAEHGCFLPAELLRLNITRDEAKKVLHRFLRSVGLPVTGLVGKGGTFAK